MVLAIDAVGAKHGGAATVLLDVVTAARAMADEVVVFCSPAGLRRFDLPPASRVRLVEAAHAESPLGRVLWHRRGVGRALARCGADAVLFLSGGGVAPAGVRSTTLIQQSLPFSAEALRQLAWRDRLRVTAIRREMRASARRAAAVVTQTPTMRRWVVEGLAVPEGRVHVIPPGPPDLPVAPARAGVAEAMAAAPPDRRILYVGNASRYKNLALLAAALPLVRAQLPDAMLFGTLEASHPLSRQPGVSCLPYLRGGDLRAAYESATVLVMPSLVETVGLPMLEAASCGTPVVAADRPYAHDVCGDAASFFDPLDPAAAASRIVRLLTDARVRAHLGALGRALVERRRSERPYERLVELATGRTVESGRTRLPGGGLLC